MADAFQISPSSETFHDSLVYQVGDRQHRRRKLPYHQRKFLAIDGEGVTPEKSHRQSYVLLGASDGGSVSEEINSELLTSAECLQFLIDLERKYPSHIKVGFGISYDVNMMIRDIPENRLRRLLTGQWVSWESFKLQWISGKWFSIRQRDTTVIVFDVCSFFGGGGRGGFIPAVTSFLTPADDVLAQLEAGKANRGNFDLRHLETEIRPYMRVELRLLCELMTLLRELIIDHLGLPLKSWHGPGSIASALLAAHDIRDYRPEVDPHDITRIAQYAYKGGRFETLRTGLYGATSYYYDLVSAYPTALATAPALTDSFDHDTRPEQGVQVPPFSVHRVRYIDTKGQRTGFNPLPLRTRSGALFYPNVVQDWVWGPEVNAILRHQPASLEILESVYFADDGRRPFAFLADLHGKRLEWQDQGHPAAEVAKTGYTSIYGKLAQRVGWDAETRTGPHWHQLRWAGYITSYTRAVVYDAMMQAPDRMIAVETDGIFSEVPLDLPIGRGLGQWKVEEFDALMYLQSGVYFALTGDTWATGRTRGFSSNHAHAATALRAVPHLEPLVTEQRKFHGLRSSIGTDDWLSWQTHSHVLNWGGAGKRYHPTECDDCNAGSTWHRTVFSLPAGAVPGDTYRPDWYVSQQHKLPWMD
ncbi:hypothetical protein ACWCPQ_34335 [Nocardia sp. NPDC001965]